MLLYNIFKFYLLTIHIFNLSIRTPNLKQFKSLLDKVLKFNVNSINSYFK